MNSSELDDSVRDVISHSVAPALILELPSERILAASPGATSLLTGNGGEVVGRSLEEFASDRPTGALDLLTAGKLNGYEAERVIRRPDGTAEPIRIWVRRLGEKGSPRFVLAVFAEEGRPGCVPAPPGESEAELTAVLGTTDSALQITQISVDAERVLGDRTPALIGRSLLSLFAAEDAPSLLWALAQAATDRSGVTLRLHAKSSRGEAIACEVLLVALEPATAFGFALLPSDESLNPLVQSQHMTQAMWRLSRETLAVSASREADAATLRDPSVLSSMSSREIEIVLRLLSGDRVPEIARSLYLAQGTVRNHLSSVFHRLGVSSQQELIALLRGRVPPGS